MFVNFPVLIFFTTIFIISPITKSQNPLTISFPPQLNGKIRTDPAALKSASTDYGHIVTKNPAAVLYPSSIDDIQTLIKFSYENSAPFTIAAKGSGFSIHGQAMASNGVVVNMSTLRNSSRIVISGNGSSGFYADVGGEQMWIDVLNATLKQGLSPVSWTDYLYVTVGGTLCNAGIGGQTYRKGPQINNVLELDVITGKGELVTCSRRLNAELFYGVLGGLGQFGIITRARIVLEPAPKQVKWTKVLYTDFGSFSRDQETMMLEKDSGSPNYLEGYILMEHSFLHLFSPSDQPKVLSLINQYGIIYCLEAAWYYDSSNCPRTVNQEVKDWFRRNSSGSLPIVFSEDVGYVDFLNRVRDQELALRQRGLWEVPHPWLNLFIPKSRMADFDNGVFRNIFFKQNFTSTLIIVYPMFRNKWDEKMSAVIPDEDVFYDVASLHSSGFNNWQDFDNKNKEILEFCEDAGIKFKQYLAYHARKEEWINHFGSKWNTFQRRKTQFDPKMILSPGQQIFNKKEARFGIRDWTGLFYRIGSEWI